MVVTPGQLSLKFIHLTTAIITSLVSGCPLKNKMARAKECFSVEQVVEVCAQSNAQDHRETSDNLDDIIQMSVDKFRPLKEQLSDYYRFRREAVECLNYIFLKHERNTDAMDRVLKSKVEVWSLLSCEVQIWLKYIYRRMRASPRARNPWFIEFKRDFSAVVFNHLCDAVRNTSTSYGVVVEATSLKFTQLNRLVCDLAKFSCLTKNDVSEKLQKRFGPKQKNFVAKLLASDKKPFVITFIPNKMEVNIRCYYGCWNEFGYGFHG